MLQLFSLSCAEGGGQNVKNVCIDNEFFMITPSTWAY